MQHYGSILFSFNVQMIENEYRTYVEQWKRHYDIIDVQRATLLDQYESVGGDIKGYYDSRCDDYNQRISNDSDGERGLMILPPRLFDLPAEGRDINLIESSNMSRISKEAAEEEMGRRDDDGDDVEAEDEVGDDESLGQVDDCTEAEAEAVQSERANARESSNQGVSLDSLLDERERGEYALCGPNDLEMVVHKFGGSEHWRSMTALVEATV